MFVVYYTMMLRTYKKKILEAAPVRQTYLSIHKPFTINICWALLEK